MKGGQHLLELIALYIRPGSFQVGVHQAHLHPEHGADPAGVLLLHPMEVLLIGWQIHTGVVHHCGFQGIGIVHIHML